MRRILIILVIHFIISCSNSGGNKSAISDSVTVADSLDKSLSDTTITISVSYAAIECDCAQWFETKFEKVDFLEGVERFYLEPVSGNLVNANEFWDGQHLPLTLNVTGRFSREKEVPVSYHTKGIPEKARIFWYEKISVVP